MLDLDSSFASLASEDAAFPLQLGLGEGALSTVFSKYITTEILPLGLSISSAFSESYTTYDYKAGNFFVIAVSTYSAAYKTFAESRPIEEIRLQTPRIYPPV